MAWYDAYFLNPVFGTQQYLPSALGPSPQYKRMGGLFGKGGVGSRVSSKIIPFIPSGPYGSPTSGKELLGYGVMRGLEDVIGHRKLKLLEGANRRAHRELVSDIGVVYPYQTTALAQQHMTRGTLGSTWHREAQKQLQHRVVDMPLSESYRRRRQVKDLKKWNWLFG